jgi:hypothetical protein
MNRVKAGLANPPPNRWQPVLSVLARNLCPPPLRSLPPKSSTANPIDRRVCEARSFCRGAALLRPSLPQCRRQLGPPACDKQTCYLGRRICVTKPLSLASPCRARERRSRIGSLGLLRRTEYGDC